MNTPVLNVPSPFTRPEPVFGVPAAGGPSGTAVDPAVFDPAGLMDRLECDEELAMSIVAEFADDLPRLVEGLRTLVASRALPEATRQAHTLKGAAATVGAAELSAAALEAERAGHEGALDAMAALLPRVDHAYRRLGAALRDSGWVPTFNL